MEWSKGGRKGGGRVAATNDYFLPLATMEWRILANGRTDATDAAFQCNITVLTPGSLGRQIALHVQVRVWEVPCLLSG